MRNLTAIGRHAGRMVCTTRFLLATSVLLISSSAFAQQSYVGRFDAYAGYMYLDSPHIKLAENGFHTQVGTASPTGSPSVLTTASAPATRASMAPCSRPPCSSNSARSSPN